MDMDDEPVIISSVGNKVGKKYIIFKRQWLYREGWFKKGRVLEGVVGRWIMN